MSKKDNDDTKKLVSGRLGGLFGESKPEARHNYAGSSSLGTGRRRHSSFEHDRHDPDLDVPAYLRREAPRSTYTGRMHDDLSDLGREPACSTWERNSLTQVSGIDFRSFMNRVPIEYVQGARFLSSTNMDLLTRSVWGVMLDALAAQGIVLTSKSMLLNRKLFDTFVAQLLVQAKHQRADHTLCDLEAPERTHTLRMVELEDGHAKEPEAEADYHYVCSSCGNVDDDETLKGKVPGELNLNDLAGECSACAGASYKEAK